MTAAHGTRPSVAVIGSGVSGLAAAHLLDRTHRVTLYEAQQRLGGHAHTHDVVDPGGRTHAVDSGFIVHNDRTYPLLQRLLAELGVATRPTEMSMSVHCRGCGLQYAGGRGLAGILADPATVGSRAFWRMLIEIKRFQRAASAFLGATGASEDRTTYGAWLAARGFGRHFVRHYAIPVVACVWSSGREIALAYPARYLFRFLDHHGFLRITGSPTWMTIPGGSRTYVEAIAARLPDVRRGARVTALRRSPDGVQVELAGGERTRHDRAVIATNAGEALALLADPTARERELLGAIDVTVNDAVLHADGSLLPPAPRARASWNYVMADCGDDAARPTVSYWMNRLQGHASERPHIVSLNPSQPIDAGAHITSMAYAHPIYTPASVAAIERLPELATDRVTYAGAYHGWGFHEDGCRSGVRAAEHFGVRW